MWILKVTGRVYPARAEAPRRGRRMRRMRNECMKALRTLPQEAEWLGMSPEALNRLQHGEYPLAHQNEKVTFLRVFG